MAKALDQHFGRGPLCSKLEVRAGFEPANNGFADHPLGPLGYRTVDGIIAYNPAMDLSLAFAAALAGASLQSAPVQLAAPTARPVSAFTLEIRGGCDAGPFQIASWCPAPGTGVAGGLERVIKARVGDLVVLRLVNTGSVPDSQHGIGDHRFQFTAAEPIESCRGAACSAFGVDVYVPLGAVREVRFHADRAGRYKYYDSLWPNGYGVLVVEP